MSSYIKRYSMDGSALSINSALSDDAILAELRFLRRCPVPWSFCAISASCRSESGALPVPPVSSPVGRKPHKRMARMIRPRAHAGCGGMSANDKPGAGQAVG